MLKKFYRSTLPRERFEELFRDVRINPRPNGRIKPDSMITQDEVRRMIDSATNARDRALISKLYDSGCRIGEIATLRIRDVGFDNYGAVLKVTGKTGFRNVRIIGDSVTYMRAWLDNHPERNNLDAPVFVNISDAIRGKAMIYDDLR